MRLRYAALMIGLALAGCGSEPLRLPAPSTPVAQGVQPGAQSALVVSTPKLSDEKKYLQSLYIDPRLDPIRDKVPLQLRADVVSVGYLRNESKPTSEEKQAIKVWMQIREKAQQYQASIRGQPSQSLLQTRVRVTQAITQLYAGRLTYAGFAKKLQQIDAQHQESQRQKLGQRE